MAHSDEVYGQLSSFLQELHQIVDAAITMAVLDSQVRSRPIESSFLAAYVRDETKGRLRELAGTSLECEVKGLNNGGVQAIYQNFALRVRKERDGGGLPAGQSTALKLYYEQIPLALVWPGDSEPTTISTLNLVVLWKFDYETQTLAGMDLVLPHQWRLAVPHPATQLQPDVAPEVSYEDVEIEFAEEDDVLLEDPQDTTEEEDEIEEGEE